MNKKVSIHSETIRVDQLLKFAGLVPTGGDAKTAVICQEVRVNGEICTQRGKKLRKGDIVEFRGNTVEVCEE